MIPRGRVLFFDPFRISGESYFDGCTLTFDVEFVHSEEVFLRRLSEFEFLAVIISVQKYRDERLLIERMPEQYGSRTLSLAKHDSCSVDAQLDKHLCYDRKHLLEKLDRRLQKRKS